MELGKELRSTPRRWIVRSKESQDGFSCRVDATYSKMASMQGDAVKKRKKKGEGFAMTYMAISVYTQNTKVKR